MPRALRAVALGVVAAATANQAYAQSSPSAFTSATRYDLADHVTGTIAPDPDGSGPLHYAAVRNTYDIDGRLVRVEKGELQDWQSETVAPADWGSYTVFKLFQTVDTVYDVMDRKVKETVSSGGTAYQVTEYSYDAVGRPSCTAIRMNLATVGSTNDACLANPAGSDGPDRIAKNVYDSAGQLQQVQKGVGTSLLQNYVTYTYTDNGKQASVTDANGNMASYTYDGHDRLSRWNFPNKANVGVVSSTDYEAYTYDANGNRLSLTKRDGNVIGYVYDGLDRVTTKTTSGTSTYYGYDRDGHELYARFGAPSGTGLTQTYDGFGRLASSSNDLVGSALTLSYKWDADGNRTRLTYPDGNYFTFDYDDLDRQTAAHENGGTVVATITYDDQGRRSGDSRGLASSAYGYDAISRPASLTDNLAGSASDVTTTLAYNPASQTISRSRTNDAYGFGGYMTVNRSYARNGLNQYTTAGPASFTYDANGNLVSDGTSSFGYDIENRLISRSGGLAIAYDPSGRLWQTSGGASGTTRYLYDGDELVAEYDGAGTMLRRYLHGAGEDDPILWYEGAGLTDRRSLQVDTQGSIVSIADAFGNAVGIDSYDEYGIPGAGNSGRFQYTGQAWLPDLGMYYYKARIYSPTLGRFMQADPIGYKDQINLYAYVANDPVNGRDPSGTEGEPGVGHNSASFGEMLEEAVETTGEVARFAASRAALGGSLLLTSESAGPVPNPEAGKRIQSLQRTVFYQTRAVSQRSVDAALIEANGGVVKLRSDGKPFDHINKLRQTQAGLRTSIRQLKQQLSSHLGEDQRFNANRALGSASKALDTVNRVLSKVDRICTGTIICR